MKSKTEVEVDGGQPPSTTRQRMDYRVTRLDTRLLGSSRPQTSAPQQGGTTWADVIQRTNGSVRNRPPDL